MSERPKSASYRRGSITDGNGAEVPGHTLQKLLEDAAKTVPRAWVRPLGGGGAGHQLLTLLTTKNLCCCGEIAYYEADRKIPLVDILKDGSTWSDTIHPNDAKGTKRKFHEQSLYFAIRENHVALIQSTGLQVDVLQSFLAWLIQEKAKLAAGTFISLSNPPSKGALDKLKDHDIRGIKFGDRLFTQVAEEVPPEEGKPKPKRRKLTHRIETNPLILTLLSGLGIAQPILDKLAENADPGAIQVDVEVSYRSRGEKEASSVLRALAGTLGAQDGLETAIRLTGNSWIKGDELTIKGAISVLCPSGCIAVDDALSKLSLWLANQLKSGNIP